MASPPRRSHSILSQEIFSNASSGLSSPSPASFLPSVDSSIADGGSSKAPGTAAHVWSRGRSTVPAKPSLSTSTSSSSEWTDDEKFLTVRPASDEDRDGLFGSPKPRRRRCTAEKLPPPVDSSITSASKVGQQTGKKRNEHPVLETHDITPRHSRFTPATFLTMFKSSSASKLNSARPLTPRPARFVDSCKTKVMKGNPRVAETPDCDIPEDRENLAPKFTSTPRGTSISAGDQLSPLSPNVEIYRGSARHRHRTQLAVEDDNPFKDLASDSDADDSSDSGLEEVATLHTPTPAFVCTYF
ncbi:Hypothetical protein D9617_7g029590 [Elsinoe fawcettii]|nr:Hypothetical protein D9617_7g029590 [Elsinoe fawcettii]